MPGKLLNTKETIIIDRTNPTIEALDTSVAENNIYRSIDLKVTDDTKLSKLVINELIY